jgi:hypothetical protein
VTDGFQNSVLRAIERMHCLSSYFFVNVIGLRVDLRLRSLVYIGMSFELRFSSVEIGHLMVQPLMADLGG